MGRFLSDIRLSISTRLALWFGLSFLLLLSVFVVFLYVGFHISLHRDFQDQLEHDLARTIDLVQIDGDDASFRPGGILSSGTYDVEGTGGTYVRLLAQNRDVLGRSANMAGQTFAPDPPDGEAVESVLHEWQGSPARTVYTPVAESGGAPAAWLEVTRLESALHHELHRLGWLLFAGVPLGAAIAVAAGHHLSRRAMRPVAQITEASRQIQAEDLDRRLPTDFGVRDELTELAETLNALLDRLAASFDRERRFRADAAHEMFTPLSAIQSEIDVTLRRSRSSEEYETALVAVRVHAGRLKDIVEDLLELSRAEALQGTRGTTIDATTVVCETVGRFKNQAAKQGIRIELQLDEHVTIGVDASDLQTVVSNLVDNALKYTPHGGHVHVSLVYTETGAVLSVLDTGVGFGSKERPHLFDRFYRATDDSVGSGLGLSIVNAIVTGHRGILEAESEGPGRGSRFTVSLPRANGAHADIGSGG